MATDTTKQIALRLPDKLATAIDEDRPATTSRNAWIVDACERKLSPAPKIMPAPVQRYQATIAWEAQCKGCQTLGPPEHRECEKCGARKPKRGKR